MIFMASAFLLLNAIEKGLYYFLQIKKTLRYFMKGVKRDETAWKRRDC